VFYILSLASAVLYGAADFIGGLTSRRASALAVVTISQAAGLLFLAAALPLLPAASLSRTDWLWGIAAGITGGAGIALLYRALAVGMMSVVAPVTAVCAVAIPVLVALALGDRPGIQVSVGIVIAISAIILVSQRDEEAGSGATAARQPSGLGLALAAGVGVGLFFLSLARTSRDAGLWPMLVARTISVAMFVVSAVVARQPIALPRAIVPMVVFGGTIDMLANVLYLLASKLGPLSVVVTLSSLYPASTVVLARVVFEERLSVRQAIGIALALAAVVLIVGGE